MEEASLPIIPGDIPTLVERVAEAAQKRAGDWRVRDVLHTVAILNKDDALSDIVNTTSGAAIIHQMAEAFPAALQRNDDKAAIQALGNILLNQDEYALLENDRKIIRKALSTISGEPRTNRIQLFFKELARTIKLRCKGLKAEKRQLVLDYLWTLSERFTAADPAQDNSFWKQNTMNARREAINDFQTQVRNLHLGQAAQDSILEFTTQPNILLLGAEGLTNYKLLQDPTDLSQIGQILKPPTAQRIKRQFLTELEEHANSPLKSADLQTKKTLLYQVLPAEGINEEVLNKLLNALGHEAVATICSQPENNPLLACFTANLAGNPNLGMALLQFLLKHEPKPNSTLLVDEKRENPLHKLAQIEGTQGTTMSDRLQALRELDVADDWLQQKNNDGDTPVDIAIKNANLGYMSLLYSSKHLGQPPPIDQHTLETLAQTVKKAQTFGEQDRIGLIAHFIATSCPDEFAQIQVPEGCAELAYTAQLCQELAKKQAANHEQAQKQLEILSIRLDEAQKTILENTDNEALKAKLFPLMWEIKNQIAPPTDWNGPTTKRKAEIDHLSWHQRATASFTAEEYIQIMATAKGLTSPNEAGLTPIHLAAQRKNVPFFQALCCPTRRYEAVSDWTLKPPVLECITQQIRQDIGTPVEMNKLLEILALIVSKNPALVTPANTAALLLSVASDNTYQRIVSDILKNCVKARAYSRLARTTADFLDTEGNKLLDEKLAPFATRLGISVVALNSLYNNFADEKRKDLDETRPPREHTEQLHALFPDVHWPS